MKGYRLLGKPLFDFATALIGFVILSPVFVILAVTLAISQNTSPFFLQARVGKQNRRFSVIKFKTMNEAKDIHGRLLPDDQRLTRFGKWVRRTSMDELPQLINILKGEMSFVGPRPLLADYIALYSPEQMRRHEVRPGITGWAQINGRNSITWKEKFALDVWYVDHQTFWLDLKIIMITIVKVFKAEGISGKGVATAEKFDGKN